MWGPLIQGAAGGIAANEAQRKIDKHVHGDREDDDMFSAIHGKMSRMHEELQAIGAYYKQASEPPIDVIASLQVDPLRWQLNTKGRKHNMIFVPNGTTSISANIPGLGVFTFTPSAGWTELDFKSGTELFLSTGTQQNIIVRLSNIPLGANVV